MLMRDSRECFVSVAKAGIKQMEASVLRKVSFPAPDSRRSIVLLRYLQSPPRGLPLSEPSKIKSQQLAPNAIYYNEHGTFQRIMSQNFPLCLAESADGW